MISNFTQNDYIESFVWLKVSTWIKVHFGLPRFLTMIGIRIFQSLSSASQSKTKLINTYVRHLPPPLQMQVSALDYLFVSSTGLWLADLMSFLILFWNSSCLM